MKKLLVIASTVALLGTVALPTMAGTKMTPEQMCTTSAEKHKLTGEKRTEYIKKCVEKHTAHTKKAATGAKEVPKEKSVE